MTFTRIAALFALALAAATATTGCTPDAGAPVADGQFEVIGFDGRTAVVDVEECGVGGGLDRFVATVDGEPRTLTIETAGEARIYTVDGLDGELLFGEQAADGTTRLAGADGRTYVAAEAVPLDMVRDAFDDATLLMLDEQVIAGLGDTCAAADDGIGEMEQSLRASNRFLRPVLQWGENCPGATCAARDDSERCCCKAGQRCVSWEGGCDCEATDANPVDEPAQVLTPW